MARYALRSILGLGLVAGIALIDASASSASVTLAPEFPPLSAPQLVAPELMLNLKADPTDLPAIRSAKAATKLSPLSRSTQHTSKPFEAIPCDTHNLLTPQQIDDALQACSDRFFNVEHSG